MMSLKPFALFITVCLIAVISSCKKNIGNPKPSGSVKPIQFTINGASQNYANCFYAESFNGQNFQAVIMATNTVDTQTATSFTINFQMRLILNSSEIISAGQTYPVASASGQIQTAMLYYTPDGVSNFSSQYANAQGSVTITSVEGTTINGTFSGQLFAANDTGGKSVVYTITNGSFSAPIN